MSNRVPAVGDAPGPLSGAAIRVLRKRPVEGMSRRTLLRRSLGVGVLLWLTEVGAGTLSFLWSSTVGSAGRVRVGTLDELVRARAQLPIREGFPAYVVAARAFIVLVDPGMQAFLPGEDPNGSGTLNVRALSQICPHLGCRPNPCLEDFWFHCPCHQSRYDRLGIKPAGLRYGPAERGMDRFAVEVDADGVLTVDTSRVTLGPLPTALGQPGVIPARVPGGCA